MAAEILKGKISTKDNKFLVEYNSNSIIDNSLFRSISSGSTLFDIKAEQLEMLSEEEWREQLGKEVQFMVIGIHPHQCVEILSGINFSKVPKRKKTTYHLYSRNYGSETITCEFMETSPLGFYVFYDLTDGDDGFKIFIGGTSSYAVPRLSSRKVLAYYPIANTTIYKIIEE